ncbi:MAG: nucleotidyltransferase [Saprospiraceae bacterium]|nr:nucleotidyltransferase [Saprospiraceae bacterium]
MKHKTSLLVLAAGMGSRYGGLKQLDQFGPNGETIIDYSIYDAILAGFTKIVFIIRKSFELEFRDRFEPIWGNKIECHYVFQEMNDLPSGFKCPEDRTKPWGTGHAVWTAREVIHEPFGVINADDYYGREAIQTLYDSLANGTVSENRYSVIAYELLNTLSEHGEVNRGVCSKDDQGYLSYIKECKGIRRINNHAEYTEDGKQNILTLDSLVSMNMWGFDKSYFVFANKSFKEFLTQNISDNKSEYFIPVLVQELIDSKEAQVAVLSSDSKWFGVTYIEDKPAVMNSFHRMIEEGVYPRELI